MNNTTDHYLNLALSLASIRRGFCAPNPCVGAVLVKNAEVIATGYHWASGSVHAEVDALNKIEPSLAKRATLYVSLQPCCHTAKKTPPCTDLIIQRGISKVIYAFPDPNPAVINETNKILQQAGIECIQHRLPEIDNFYESYRFWWENKRPFTTAKLAISLDGKIAGKQGKRIQLTGLIAQQFTHQQRKRADAILTTAKTIRLDNPLLNSRIERTVYKKPLYILDGELNTPASAKVFTSAKNVTLFHNANLTPQYQDKFSQHKLRFIPIKNDNNGLNLLEVFQYIAQDGCHDLWVEAGGRCFQALAKNQLLQRAFIYVAPHWLGEAAQAAFAATSPFLSAFPVATTTLGTDVCFEFNWPEKEK
ncbi:MAG: bifunctional diaminohydroxyphosphoribosylaminopyrimidine deaminase/5-amino-6-(5-phosphoribosylamino)uracil reductase RibD [Candidatus Aquirickettsiella gammari]